MSSENLTHGTVGAYRVLRELGHGGMGVVYEAVHNTLEGRVAIKVLNGAAALNADVATRFFNEAKAASRIEHPSIVRVFEFGQMTDGAPYLVMEFLKGESLARRLRTGRPALGESLQVGWQIADALAAVHDKGVVHRDIKPDNIMLVPDPVAPGGERVKLLDFGIAKVADSGLRATRSNVVMGTPLYMSPEQCRGAGGVDAKSDVYSMGCVLYEMLAGRPPFLADGGGLVLGMHLFEEPPPLKSLAPHVPDDIAQLVGRLLLKEKQNRPAMADAARELAALLRRYRNEGLDDIRRPPEPLSALREGTAYASTLGQVPAQLRGSDRRRWLGLTALTGALAVAGILGARAYLFSAETKPPSPAAAEQKVTLQVDTQPSGAELVDLDGKTLGHTPWQTERRRAAGELRLRLRLPGHADQEVSLKTDQNSLARVVMAKLDAAPSQAAKPQPQKPAASPSRPASSRRTSSPPTRPATSRARNVPLLD